MGYSRRWAASCATVVPVNAHWQQLVRLSGLPGQAQVHAFLGGIREGRLALVRLVGPLGDVEGVLVLEQAADVVGLPRETGRGVEPQLVGPNRPAQSGVDVVLELQAVGRPQAANAQVVGVVRALEGGVDGGGEERAGEPVAAGLRDHVDQQSAGDALGARRRVVHGHFLRAAHVGQHVGRPPRALCVGGGDAVDEYPGVADAAAVDRHRAARGVDDVGAADVHVVEIDAGNHERRHLGRAAGRNRFQQFLVDHPLTVGALNIHDRRLARHRDGLLDGAHPHLGVD
jgi:hypothetical protein